MAVSRHRQAGGRRGPGGATRRSPRTPMRSTCPAGATVLAGHRAARAAARVEMRGATVTVLVRRGGGPIRPRAAAPRNSTPAVASTTTHPTIPSATTKTPRRNAHREHRLLLRELVTEHY